jgi:electron transport complex protein RnfC
MWDKVADYDGLDCIECGCCSYVCPPRRPLVQLIKAGKAAVAARTVKR